MLYEVITWLVPLVLCFLEQRDWLLMSFMQEQSELVLSIYGTLLHIGKVPPPDREPETPGKDRARGERQVGRKHDRDGDRQSGVV